MNAGDGILYADMKERIRKEFNKGKSGIGKSNSTLKNRSELPTA